MSVGLVGHKLRKPYFLHKAKRIKKWEAGGSETAVVQNDIGWYNVTRFGHDGLYIMGALSYNFIWMMHYMDILEEIYLLE